MDQPRNKALYNKIKIKINQNKINNKVFYLLKNHLMKLILKKMNFSKLMNLILFKT
jgi:hypothetical protein